jgi:hypothetical protein
LHGDTNAIIDRADEAEAERDPRTRRETLLRCLRRFAELW